MIRLFDSSGLYVCPFQDANVHLYSIEGNSLRDSQQVLPVKGPVTDLQFSPNGNFLLVGDANKVLTVFSVADGYKVRYISVFFNVDTEDIRFHHDLCSFSPF